ncbi:MAG: TRAP transporter substrate-binding protein [Myxococcota bacterium]
MRRREFIGKAAGTLGGVATLAACGRGSETAAGGAPAVHTVERVRWRLASSFPRGLDTIYGASEIMARNVDAMTGGRFQIRTYPSGELVPGLQVLDAVHQGTVQIGQTASYYYTGKDPALAFDTSVPFGLTSRQQTAWLEEGGGRELMAPVFADFGVVAIPGGNTGTQMGGWFNRAIDTPDDIRGLKMRIPGLGGEVMSRLGATVQVIAGGDIYPALERGAIDATEWIGPYDDEKLGFHKVAKLYYYPGWWEPGPNLSYVVSRDAWMSLSKELQQVLRVSCQASASIMQALYDAKNPPAMTRLIAGGTDFRPFSDAVLEACRGASDELLEGYAAAEPRYRKIYGAWKKFRTESSAWFGTAELAFARFAALQR